METLRMVVIVVALVVAGWNVAQLVGLTYAQLGPWCARLIDKVTLLSDAEYRRRWVPRPFLRPALRSARQTLTLAKEMDRVFGDMATVPYDEVAREARQSLLDDEEYQADVALFLADSRLAIELGFEAPRCCLCGGELPFQDKKTP